MCGIAGIIGSAEPVNERVLVEMRDSFTYRGPDDAGIWIGNNERVGLAHRRLSILDRSPLGHQPMVDKATNNVICYNGEVYNYVEIRKELERKGYTFTSGTDTEVILKAYSAYGEKCLDYFNGMFAFAIWDVVQQQLFMARDRLGVKPFYYRLTNKGEFYFASEIKALRLTQARQPEVRLDLIDQYMSFGYVPGENTLEEGIHRLLPGHKAVFQKGRLEISKYWDLKFQQDDDLGFDHYLERGRELLNSAISLRLRSDVPLGIFLSGGIDSSAVVGLLAERTTEQLKTFSVAYDFGLEFNETNYARMVASKFNTDHHELFVTDEDFKNFIPNFSYLMDEPVTESAAISLQLLSQLTRDYVTVVLSGEGSDEVFGGYDLYRYMQSMERFRKMLTPTIANALSTAGSKILPAQSKLRKYNDWMGLDLESRYRGISTYEESNKDRLYRRDFQEYLSTRGRKDAPEFLAGLMEKTRGQDVLSRMLYFDTKTWLVDDLLIKADRMSMAASLELRVPFLDYRLVEFGASMPSRYKVRDGQGKYILKKMMEGLLPNEIIYRKKMGFPTPLKQMFQGGLTTYARDTLMSSNTRIHQIFERRAIESILEAHVSGKHDHHRVLWQLVVLEEWFNAIRISD